MLWEPQIEGRNINSTFFEINFRDPFLWYVYIASISFFFALYQIIKVLGYAANNRSHSPEVLEALQAIKYCAIALIIFVIGAEVFIMFSSSDDRAGGVFIGFVIALGSGVAATVASLFKRNLTRSLLLKSDVAK